MPKKITDATGNVVIVHGKIGQVVKGDQNHAVRIDMRGNDHHDLAGYGTRSHSGH